MGERHLHPSYEVDSVSIFCRIVLRYAFVSLSKKARRAFLLSNHCQPEKQFISWSFYDLHS
jgi:hypothetical protein